MILSHYRRAGARSRTRKWTCRRAKRKAASGTKTQCADHDLGRPRARETCACRRRGLHRSQRVFLSKAKSKQISTCVSAGGGGTQRAPRVLTLQSAPDCYFWNATTAPLPTKTNAEHTVTPHAAFPNYAFAAAGPRAETYVFTCIMEGAPERPFLVFSSIAALSPCITNDEQSSRSVVFRWLRKRPPEAHM